MSRKREERLAFWVAGLCGLGFLGVLGWLLADRSAPPPQPPQPPQATAPLPADIAVQSQPAVRLPAAPPLPAWQRHAVPAAINAPMVAVVIDDLGLDRQRTARTVALPGPLTLAYLPYAGALSRQTAVARDAGHEIILHMPMQPQNPATDPGPGALLLGMSAREVEQSLTHALDRIGPIVGVNNHMGSAVTADPALMAAVMQVLKTRELVFLDSRTTGMSQAAAQAASLGVPHASRDVFLDHDSSPDAVASALAKTEAIARRHGIAVAIGHPKDVTLEALAAWLPGLAARGITLVPLSTVIRAGLEETERY